MPEIPESQTLNQFEMPSEVAGRKSAPAKTKRSRAFSYAWAAAGFVCFGLGMVGVVLPLIPTTPFVLLAALCFARSSKRLDDWFQSTKLYKMVFESYVKKREMTLKAKLTILIPVTLLLGIGFLLMPGVPVGRAVVAIVWVCHIVYFGFIVKTEKAARE